MDKGHGLYICWNSNTFFVSTDLTDSELSLTSLDPDILSELGGHAHQESLTLSSDSFMEVVTTATNNLKLHRQGMEKESGKFIVGCNEGGC